MVPAGTQHQFVNTGPTPLVSNHSKPILVYNIAHLSMRDLTCIYTTMAANEKAQILYTIYSPAEHNPQTVHQTKEEGDEEEENGKDEAPEWAHKSMSENEKAGLVNTSGKY